MIYIALFMQKKMQPGVLNNTSLFLVKIVNVFFFLLKEYYDYFEHTSF